jgi:hypothetical protein
MKLQIIFTKNKILIPKKEFAKIFTNCTLCFFRETNLNDDFGEYV